MNCLLTWLNIYPGNHSFLVLHDFLEKMASTPFRITELFNDRYSYFLTFRQWAQNLESNRDHLVTYSVSSIIGDFGCIYGERRMNS